MLHVQKKFNPTVRGSCNPTKVLGLLEMVAFSSRERVRCAVGEEALRPTRAGVSVRVRMYCVPMYDVCHIIAVLPYARLSRDTWPLALVPPAGT